MQLKHHSKQASLTDSSNEIWKTLRIWSEAVRQGTVNINQVVLSLVTTAVASEDSIAALLRPSNGRDPEAACLKLIKIAKGSENQELKKSFAAFLSLTLEQRKDLVGAVQILDGSANIIDVASDIRERIKFSVRPKYLGSLYERLEGWWFGRAIEHLSRKSAYPINGFEVHNKIVELAEQFRTDALPIDFFDAIPPEPPDPEGDNRIFVQQLREIGVGSRRVEKAILDYYRAFQQRSRWAREDLFIMGDEELHLYEKKLVDEWERYTLAVYDELEPEQTSEIDMQKIGRQIYNWVDLEADFRIRPLVSEEYVMRGSYHILADQSPPRVWWHPKFKERLVKLLT